ncbi:uncharacterized protein BKA78DRAFT_119811 [Phyllosticta capitalensis]|uniref:uncharacterized protein n=1 Tax=Phyllosticta capitalensis TaxID=121624 RepID=UPI003130D66A
MPRFSHISHHHWPPPRSNRQCLRDTVAPNSKHPAKGHDPSGNVCLGLSIRGPGQLPCSPAMQAIGRLLARRGFFLLISLPYRQQWLRIAQSIKCVYDAPVAQRRAATKQTRVGGPGHQGVPPPWPSAHLPILLTLSARLDAGHPPGQRLWLRAAKYAASGQRSRVRVRCLVHARLHEFEQAYRGLEPTKDGQ